MSAPKNVTERAAKLRELLTHHAELYYTHDAPEISDSAYDTLHAELVGLETQYPELATPSSVTGRIVGGAMPFLKKIRHAAPQWSFNDAFSEDDIRAFDERVRKVSGMVPAYDLELKIDGL